MARGGGYWARGERLTPKTNLTILKSPPVPSLYSPVLSRP
nr:MAG TPA_asm: hypothetical protein [Caudoviricetes sp.]